MQHAISATLPSIYQNLLKFVEIWRSYDRNKNAQFFETQFSFSATDWKQIAYRNSNRTASHSFETPCIICILFLQQLTL